MAKVIGYPSLLRRLAAMFYDCWLVAACLLLSTAFMIGLRVVIQGTAAIPDGTMAISDDWQLPSFIVNVLVIVGFFGYFWTKLGQTLGMQTWRLRIDRAEGGNISWQQVMVRLAVSLVSLSCFGLGYLWCLVDKNQQSLHDKLSKTQTVLLEKRTGKA